MWSHTVLMHVVFIPVNLIVQHDKMIVIIRKYYSFIKFMSLDLRHR